MIRFLAENWVSIVTVAVLAIVFIFLVAKTIINRVKGKSSCACSCSACPAKKECKKD